MIKLVLDSSAVLAALQKERGSDRFLSRRNDAAISAINFAEVISELGRNGGDVSQVLSDLHDLLPNIIPFDADQARLSGLVHAHAHRLGMSLGDLACLALAKNLGVPALTADPTWADWAKLDLGISIELVGENSSEPA